MTAFAVYSAATGEILSTLTGFSQDEVKLNLSSGQELFEGEARDTLHWIVPATGQRMDRIEMVPTVTTAPGETRISNIPDPCTVIWEGQQGEATGGEVTITFDEPGTKQLTLKASPQYLDHEMEVEIP